MAVEFIGSVVRADAQPGSTPMPGAAGPGPDPDYPIRAAAHDDEAGFDKLLVGYGSSAPDGLVVANEILTTTSRLGVVIARVPGPVAPTVTARQYATLAAFHPGRVALHAVTETRAADELRDGDTCLPTARSSRAAEFLEIVRLAWGSPQPFDYSGTFYQVAGAHSTARPAEGCLPIYFSGESTADVRVGAAYADVYLLPDGPLPAIASQAARVRAVGARYGRSPRIGVSLRLLASPTERAARDRVRSLHAGAHAVLMPDGPHWIPSAIVGSVGSRPVSLAGSYDRVARLLHDYIRIGVSSLVLGHDPQTEAADCAEVIARVRDKADGLRRFAVTGNPARAAAREGVSADARRPGLESACRPPAVACPPPGSRA